MAPSTLESSELASDASLALYEESSSLHSHPLGLGILTTTDNCVIATTDNCMITHNRNVNAVAFKSSHACVNALILCARRAESVIHGF